MATLNRLHPRYDTHLPIQIDGEEGYRSSLVFRVLEGTHPSTVGRHDEKLVHFELTDDRDPFFLFHADISDSSFPQFRRDRGIACELADLPKMVIGLFHSIVRPAGTPDLVHGSTTTRYTAQFVASTGLFSIHQQASNGLCSIIFSFMLTAGSDQAIKEYLAARLTLSLASIEQQAERINQLDNAQQALKQSELKLLDEMEQMRNNTTLDQKALLDNHASEMKKLADTLSMQIRLKEQQLEDQRRAAESEKASLAERCAALTEQLSETTGIKNALQQQLTDVSMKLAKADEEHQRRTEEVERLSSQCRHADNTCSSLTNELTVLRQQVATLTMQLEQKDGLIERDAKTLAAIEEMKSDKTQQIEELQGKIKVMSKEIYDLKHALGEKQRMIAKNTTDRDIVGAALKQRDTLLQAQEAELEATLRKLKQAQADDEANKLSLQNLEYHMKLLCEQISKLEEQRENDAKLIAEKATIIEHLQKCNVEVGGALFFSPPQANSTNRAAVNVISPSQVTPDRYTGSMGTSIITPSTAAPLPWSMDAMMLASNPLPSVMPMLPAPFSALPRPLPVVPAVKPTAAPAAFKPTDFTPHRGASTHVSHGEDDDDFQALMGISGSKEETISCLTADTYQAPHDETAHQNAIRSNNVSRPAMVTARDPPRR